MVLAATTDDHLTDIKNKDIAVFVDVQNIYYTTRDAYQRHFNYTAFWNDISQRGHIRHAFAYAIDRGDSKQRQFQQILRNTGFEVKLKPFIQRKDGTAKGDWDVGITLDVMEYATQVDTIVLASGDGDFDLLLQKVMSRLGVTTEVYGVPELTAASLIHSASHFYPITESLLL